MNKNMINSQFNLEMFIIDAHQESNLSTMYEFYTCFDGNIF